MAVVTVRGILCAGLVALVPAAAAAEDLKVQETVVVTAAPPDPVGNQAFSNVTVTPKQLRANHQLDASLKQVPGLSLFRRDSSVSSNPTTQGISLRSIAPSGAGRALVTLDGVPQNDPFGNWVIWTSLPSEDLGKGEVVRGAGAGPYGAGALTGVIALDEASGTGLLAADLSGGTLGQIHAAAAGGVDIDRFNVLASVSQASSAGWIPIGPDQRGPADDALTLDARSASLRVQTVASGDTLISARAGAYQENRHSGVVGASSSADGITGSFTIAHPQHGDDPGWRLQVWLRDVGLTNVTNAVGANRATVTPASNQYAVPATGYGANAALRGGGAKFNWEVGGDLREAEGESRELFSFQSGAFTGDRHSGGHSVVGGLYAEGAYRDGGWLYTFGLRADRWETSNGHVVQRSVSTGDITLDSRFPSKGGTLPTGRLGLRRDYDSGFYWRGAAYEGFRAPSLNELYRPFRLGNVNTLGNPDLSPEQLYGVEIGGGWQDGVFSIGGDVFVNQLHRAVTNVTLGETCPPDINFPCITQAGVTQVQRRNVGDIDAAGVEGEARYRIAPDWTATAAFDYVAAHVDGGSQAPLIDGLRPAQAPRWTVTAGIDTTALDRIEIEAHLRYESLRYADDLNTFRLGAAVTADARVSYAVTGQVSAYVYGDNLFDARVASTASFGNTSTGMGPVVSYAQPLVIGGGVSFTQ